MSASAVILDTSKCASSMSPHEPILLCQQHSLKQKSLDAHTLLLIEDDVHGVIHLPSHIQEIVQHPIFQRLKKVHQLGFLSRILQPLANHTRYDHCLGTYKSAQDQLEALERNSNYELKLPQWCHQAVEIAALLHDVGHGPFSHAWELVCPNTFDHEDNALACVDDIFNDCLSSELILLRDNNNGRGVQLIKALIKGSPELLAFPMLGHLYIFDIVHNRRCGLDVDKWDYLRRDNKSLKILSPKEMDFDDLFLKSRISKDGQRIEYRFEDYHRIYRLFEARWRLHLEAYKIPNVLACDKIFAELVTRLQPQLREIRATNGPQWLDLYDDRVLELLESDKLYIYIREPNRLRCIKETSAELEENVLRVESKIPGPGLVMMPDEAYALYGDKRKKLPIERCLNSTLINHCFKLDP